MQNAITVNSLTKTYRLYHSKAGRIAEIFLPFSKRYHQEYHALRNISFDVAVGECVGIIGRNGAGKSTLLKVLTGVLSPTEGTVEVHGRIASLLELGAGFNPELTGRENIYFNGTLMGCSRAEVESRIDEIIAFADIGEFIDQPVKIYSSGMFVRLAFSVSVHVEPNVLIVDEALAVGDVRFQKKCIDFMRRFKDSGKTILFVSHDIYTVKSFCNRLILLNDGQLDLIGVPNKVANRYHQIMFPKPAETPDHTVSSGKHLDLQSPSDDEVYWLNIDVENADHQWGNGAAWIRQLRISGIQEPNIMTWQDKIVIEAVVRWDPATIARISQEHSVPTHLLIGYRLENSQGWVITNFMDSVQAEDTIDIDLLTHSSCVIRCRIGALKLAAGHYFITPGLAIGTKDNFFPVKEYTNLVHLYCDARQSVMGQMMLDYDISLLEKA